ncbi:MAG: polysaccharide biosynthesis protein [Phycisphaerales bacterium]|nr:polysaccharide biosynthesis protein [Phycisphaerales bacterium]
MIAWIDRFPRRGKQFIALVSDAVIFAVALWMALAIRLETWWPRPDGKDLVMVCLAAVVIGVSTCWASGLYREITRYVGHRFAVRVVYAVTITTLVLGFLALMIDRAQGLPRLALIGFWMAALIGVGATRVLARQLIRSGGQRAGSRILIYGASDVGAGLVSLLSQDRKSIVVGFVDDDPSRVGSEIQSRRVYAPADIGRVIRKERVDTVLLALPESCRRRRREIFQELSSTGARLMMVPTLNEIAEGTSRTDAVRVMKIEDLLGRAPVAPIQELLSRDIGGKNVLITGAGGSIGSEIARQAVRQGPRRIVLLDNCEFNLYSIEGELRSLAAGAIGVQITGVLGSVLDQVRLACVLREHSIETVYHAAAYKHVPIVEANEVEGVSVNAIGTLRVAQAAISAGVKSFVLISTDKAVRPTSVMGASKRLAEKCLQALADWESRNKKHPTTRFVMVRFGNVLASSGSVVPHFTEQIRRGGPVTITHPEITRYFMTIPEASSLVIQAGAMGRGGEVFVLDMGDPVRIIDLARNMIRLAGYLEKNERQPNGDIEIQVTGLRPGEKLYEELLIDTQCAPTEHGGITQARERFTPWEQLETQLHLLEAALDQHDVPKVRELLQRYVSGDREFEDAIGYAEDLAKEPRTDRNN